MPDAGSPIPDAGARGRALQCAGLLLAHRDRAPAEIERTLARAFAPEVAAAVTAELTADGLVDERRFAAAHAAHRLARGWGPRRIRYDLEQAGVGEDVIAEVVAGLAPEDVAAAAARASRGRDGPDAWRRRVARGFDLDGPEG